MAEIKTKSNWKNIIVIDENQKEIFRLEVGEKIQAKPPKNVSTLYKKIMLIRDKQFKLNTSNLFKRQFMEMINNPANFSNIYPPHPPIINLNKTENKESKNENSQEITIDSEFNLLTNINDEQSADDFFVDAEYNNSTSQYFLF